MDLVPENKECPLFLKDLKSNWQHINVPKHSWTMEIEHLNELYDSFKVGDVRNVLSLRLFVSSIFEVATSDPQKLMNTIFEEDLIRQIAANNRQIYEAIEQTTHHLAWKIRKAQILIFRRTSPNHGWESVRKVLIDILKYGNNTDQQIAGMTASILQEVVEANPKTWREDAPLISRHRFPDVFRSVVSVFNESIGEYLWNSKCEIVYESVAARLCYFYARLAADAWRILVIRNGPKEATEWMFIHRCVTPINSNTAIQNHHRQLPAPDSLESSDNECAEENVKPVTPPKVYKTNFGQQQQPQVAVKKQEPSWEPLTYTRKPIPNLFDDLQLSSEPRRVIKPPGPAIYPSTQQKPLNRNIIYSKRVEKFSDDNQ